MFVLRITSGPTLGLCSFTIIIIPLGEERAGLRASHAFICLLCMRWCLFCSLGVRGWLWLVIVALPGLFYYFLF